MHPVLREFLWILGLGIAGAILFPPLIATMSPLPFSAGEVLVIAPITLVLPIVLGYTIRQSIQRFQPHSANVILIIAIALQIILCSLILMWDSVSSGWTIYPPLSAMPKAISRPSLLQVGTFLFQMPLLGLLTFVCIKTGIKRRRVKNMREEQLIEQLSKNV